MARNMPLRHPHLLGQALIIGCSVGAGPCGVIQGLRGQSAKSQAARSNAAVQHGARTTDNQDVVGTRLAHCPDEAEEWTATHSSVPHVSPKPPL